MLLLVFIATEDGGFHGATTHKRAIFILSDVKTTDNNCYTRLELNET
jgi:hypothetical protein